MLRDEVVALVDLDLIPLLYIHAIFLMSFVIGQHIE